MAEDFCEHCDNLNEHNLCTGLLDHDDQRCTESVLRCACTCRSRTLTQGDGAGCEVTKESAEKAIKVFAELWGNALFDCGPQDYEWMGEHILERMKAPSV